MNPELDELVESLMEPLQEVVVCLSHSWGGLEQVAVNDALDRGACGLNVRVLCLEGSPIHENLLDRTEVTLIPLEFRPRNYFDLKMRGEVQKLIEKGVSLVHCHQTSLLGSIVPWLWSHPRVAAFASRHIMNRHDKRDLFHQAIYSRLDALIVMSQTLKQNVLDTHSLKEKQVQVVNLGLDFDQFDPVKVDPAHFRALWGADAQTVVIGLVGRIDPAKGQSTFIKAAAGLMMGRSDNQAKSQKVKFVIVGEETLGRASTYLEDLKRMVSQFRLEDSVIFAGYQDNIPEVMGAFDILVMPSRQEAFGLVAIEAMAMKCPIVISRGGSAAEIVGNQDFGLLVRPEDAFDLQHQIKHLLDHPEERAQMGERARGHVMAHYDRKVRLKRTLELYDHALKIRAQIDPVFRLFRKKRSAQR